MNHDARGDQPADDFPFLGPAVSPRRRESGPLPGPGDLAAPFVGRASAAHESAQPAPVAESGPAAEQEDEGLEALPGEGWPSDDFPWLIPAEPESEPAAAASSAWAEAPAAGAESTEAAEEEEPFPWDEAPSAPAAGTAGGFGWEGEPSIGYEEGAPASSSAWELEPAPAGSADDAPESVEAGYSWHEEAEEPEEADTLPFAGIEGPVADADAAEPEAPRVQIPGREAEPSGWAWSDETAVEDLASLEDRWESGSEHVSVDEEIQATGAGWGWDAEASEAAPATGEAVRHPGAEPPSMAVPEAPPMEFDEEEAAAGVSGDAAPEDVGTIPAAVPAGALEDVAARLERIARTLRTGKPDEALEQGDPLQLLITGYALGYAEARKKLNG